MRTLAHISDLHFGRVDETVAEGLIADLNSIRPSLTVVSGDFTQRASSEQYNQAADYLKRLPSPQLVVPGNHDIPLWDILTRFFAPTSRYTAHITRDLRPVYEDNELLVIGINTARPFTWDWDGWWKDGRVSAEQLIDIRLRACRLPSNIFKVVVTHHPFIPPPGERKKGIVHGATRALDEMENCGIDLLLAGHLHVGYSGDVRTHHEAVKRSILSMQAGTAISTRRRNEPNAYNLITIHNATAIALEVRAWTGQAFVPMLTTSFEKRDNIWHAAP